MFSLIEKLKERQGFIRYFKNTSWMMAEQFLRIIAGLIVGIWVARFLGPEQFGLFSYALAFTSIFGGIAKLGLDGIMARELVNYPEKRDIYLGTAFWLKVIGAFIAIGLMVIIVPFTGNDSQINLYIFIIAAGLIFQSFEVVQFYFQSQVMAKIVSICKVIQLAFSSIIKIYLVFTEAELIYFVLVTVFDAFTLSVSYFIAYKLKKHSTFYKFFDFRIAKELLKDSWPLIISIIFVMIYMRIDQIMIKEMLGEYEVGIYSAALRFSEAFYFIPVLITNSLFPAILNAKKQSEDIYKQRLLRLYTFLMWLAIIIALLISYLSESIVLLLLGANFQEAGQVLMIHVWATLFIFIGVASAKYLIAEEMTILSLKRTIIGAVINVVLNYYLIQLYGVSGAAMATVLSLFVANLLFDLSDRRLHAQFFLKIKSFFLPWFAWR